MKDNHLAPMIRELEAAAKALQASLLSRNIEDIQTNLVRQEKSVGMLNRLQQESADGLENETRHDPELRQLLKRSRTVVHANRALSQRFLDVIDQTLSRLGGAASYTYTGHNTASVRRAPVLVSQQG